MKNISNLLISLLLLASTVAITDFTRVKLFGNKTSSHYYFQLFVGNPPQKQKIIADTGSSLMIVKCSNQCLACEQSTLSNYQPKSSTTNSPLLCDSQQYTCSNPCLQNSANVTCKFHYEYYNYSTLSMGTMQSDIMRFDQNEGTDDAFSAFFGCANRFVSNVEIKENGIFGLAFTQQISPIFKWFNQEGRNAEKVLTVCLGDKQGYFQLGANDNSKGNKQKAVSRYAETKLTDVKSISFGQTVLYNQQLDTGQIIILDTGTTWSKFPIKQYNQLVTIIKDICKRALLNCNQITQITEMYCFTLINTDITLSVTQYADQLFPLLNLEFQNMNISVKPSQYLFNDVGRNGGSFCVASKPGRQNQKIYILGVDVLRNKEVTYHIDQKFVQITPNVDCAFQSVNNYAYQSGQASKISIVISYTILVLVLALTIWGSKLVRSLISLKKRFGKRQLQFVEQSY